MYSCSNHKRVNQFEIAYNIKNNLNNPQSVMNHQCTSQGKELRFNKSYTPKGKHHPVNMGHTSIHLYPFTLSFHTTQQALTLELKCTQASVSRYNL